MSSSLAVIDLKLEREKQSFQLSCPMGYLESGIKYHKKKVKTGWKLCFFFGEYLSCKYKNKNVHKWKSKMEDIKKGEDISNRVLLTACPYIYWSFFPCHRFRFCWCVCRDDDNNFFPFMDRLSVGGKALYYFVLVFGHTRS